jgi:hypothetical protein
MYHGFHPIGGVGDSATSDALTAGGELSGRAAADDMLGGAGAAAARATATRAVRSATTTAIANCLAST